MFRKMAWRSAALTIAALGPAGLAGASEPPSTKVAYWHDQFCPRDLTPVVTGPCYGYYPTRWRVMPPCDEPGDLVLPPVGTPVGQTARPTASKAAAKKPAVMPTPYGTTARQRDPSLKADWTARPVAGQETLPPTVLGTKDPGR